MSLKNAERRLLISKVLMIISLIFLGVSLIFLYIAHYPKQFNHVLHLVGFKYHLNYSEER